jgi:hypothetical protein
MASKNTQQSLKPLFKRTFLQTLIISLVLSAIAGIIVFLVGSFDDLEIRILFTTVIISVFSLTGLINASLLDKPTLKAFGYLALAVSTCAFLIDLQNIWINSIDTGQFAGDISIIALACAHASLLLAINTKKGGVRIVRMFTLCFITILAGLIIYVINNFDTFADDFYYRLLGVFAILDALGTITTPILNKLNKS